MNANFNTAQKLNSITDAFPSGYKNRRAERTGNSPVKFRGLGALLGAQCACSLDEYLAKRDEILSRPESPAEKLSQLLNTAPEPVKNCWQGARVIFSRA